MPGKFHESPFSLNRSPENLRQTPHVPEPHVAWTGWQVSVMSQPPPEITTGSSRGSQHQSPGQVYSPSLNQRQPGSS
jgi:hypothetical protein